jgi:hypothetical protein
MEIFAIPFPKISNSDNYQKFPMNFDVYNKKVEFGVKLGIFLSNCVEFGFIRTAATHKRAAAVHYLSKNVDS